MEETQEQTQPQETEPIIPPQGAGEAAPQLAAANPFDTSAQEDELSALDSDFANYYAENMPDEIEELFFEDRAAFLMEVERAKVAYIQEKIEPMQARKKELSDSIAQNKQGAAIWQAQADFIKAYPDADLDSLLKFYNEELSPRQKQELESEGDLFKAYEKIYRFMQGEDEREEEKPKRNLPKQTNAQFGSSRGLDLDLRDSDLPINRR